MLSTKYKDRKDAQQGNHQIRHRCFFQWNNKPQGKHKDNRYTSFNWAFTCFRYFFLPLPFPHWTGKKQVKHSGSNQVRTEA